MSSQDNDKNDSSQPQTETHTSNPNIFNNDPQQQHQHAHQHAQMNAHSHFPVHHHSDPYDSDEDDQENWNEKTPLVSHSSRKNSRGSLVGSPFRSKSSKPQYSTIVDEDEDDTDLDSNKGSSHRGTTPSPTNYNSTTPMSTTPTKMSCRFCKHSPILKEWVFCPNCGTRVNENASIGYSADDDEASVFSKSMSSVSTITTMYLDNFKTSLLIPFVDEEGSWPKVCAGLGALGLVGAMIGLCIPIKNKHLSERWYRDISSMIGYSYFVYWSVCFYPQVIMNYRRKTTRGLSKDFAILNFMGWSFYSTYECAMFFNNEIKVLYHDKFGGHSTVQSNDVLFAVHAMTLSFIYLIQIVYYSPSPNSGSGIGDIVQKITSLFKLKIQTWILVIGMGTPTIVGALLLHMGILEYDLWLNYYYMISLFKICCTITKYTKQTLLNYKRKSCSGWNIWYNFLECTGGSLSLLQIVFDSIDMHDMTGITGNISKFLLGAVTIGFDIIFFIQHYVLYPEVPQSEELTQDTIPKFIGDQLDSSGVKSKNNDNSLTHSESITSLLGTNSSWELDGLDDDNSLTDRSI